MNRSLWTMNKSSFSVTGLSNALLLLVVSIIATLPSGTLAGFPIKYLLVLVIVMYFIHAGQRYSPAFLTHAGFVATFLMIYAVHGYMEFGSYAISELILALGAIVLGLLIAHIMVKRRLGIYGILKVYALSVALLAAFKACILAAFLLSPGYEAFQAGFVSVYQQITGASFLTMPLPHGLMRIYMQNDLIAALFPLAIVVVKKGKEISSWDRVGVMLCLFIVLLGFSRYNMACYGFSLLLFLWVDKKGVLFKLNILFGLLVVVAFLYRDLLEFIEIRFFSSQNEASDEIRIEQVGALLSLFWESPVVGHGLGAYTEDVVRSALAPFSYEQQILSLLPKFGALGFSIMLGYLCFLLFGLVRRKHVYVALYLIIFIFSSLFNPYLFSSNMVVIYALIFYVYFYSGFPQGANEYHQPAPHAENNGKFT